MRSSPLRDRLLNLAHADCAHVALRLRDDEVGLEIAQPFGIDAIDRERFGENGFHALVNFGTGACGVEFWTGERGQMRDRRREIALMRSPHEFILEA